MSEDIDRRVCEEARFIVSTGATVRACAARFGVSKTTIHKDMRQRLKRQSPGLAAEVGDVLDRNLRERHIRGGEATKRKYNARKE
ncbi:MAG: sporulation transcriptional regulator SpoIIID [Clostridia bacterium]|nr:sporulation transcriptional regulator SpoIIID [Clostridia bacterium]